MRTTTFIPLQFFPRTTAPVQAIFPPWDVITTRAWHYGMIVDTNKFSQVSRHAEKILPGFTTCRFREHAVRSGAVKILPGLVLSALVISRNTLFPGFIGADFVNTPSAAVLGHHNASSTAGVDHSRDGPRAEYLVAKIAQRSRSQQLLPDLGKASDGYNLMLESTGKWRPTGPPIMTSSSAGEGRGAATAGAVLGERFHPHAS